MKSAVERREERLGLLLAGSAAVLYGAAYPATAVALRSFTPLGIAGLACSIALVVVLLFVWIGVLPRPSLATLRMPGLLRLLVLATLGGFAFIGATNVAVAISGPTITGFVAPLYAVAGAVLAVPVLGEPIRRVTIGAFVLAVFGAVLLAGFDPRSSALPGVALAGLAAVIFGAYIVLSRRWSVRYSLDGTLVTIANLISRGPVLLLVEAARAPSTLVPQDVDPIAAVALLTIAFGSSSTANLFLIGSVRRVPARRTSAMLLLTPLASASISIALLGHRLTPPELAGAALILVGMAGATGFPWRRDRSSSDGSA